jgi:hypothetical protein
MTPIRKLIVAALVASASLAGLAQAQDLNLSSDSDEDRVAKVVADYSVFVDPPTGFVFVKLPAGWTFVGRSSAEDLARLPASVLTALLAPRRAEPATTALRQR